MARLRAPASSANIRRLVTVALLTIVVVPVGTVMGIEVLARSGHAQIERHVESATRAARSVDDAVARSAIARREGVHLWVVDHGTGAVSFDSDHGEQRRSDLGLPSVGVTREAREVVERGRPAPAAREHVVIARASPTGWSSGCTTYFENELLVCEAAARTPSGDIVLAQRSAPRGTSRLVDARQGLLWVGGILLAMAVALTAWLVRRLTRPLAILEQQVAARARGERATIVVADAPHEIASVAGTVDLLASRLEANHDQQARAAADLAHELKSPLARIRIALDATELAPDARHALDHHARAAVREIDAVVAGLLEIARAEAGLREDERQRCALRSLIASVLEDRPPPAGVSVDAAGQAVATVAAPALARAVGHLVDNAYAHARAKVGVTLQQDAHRVIISVEDDGPGVEAALRACLFERFVSRRAGGTGLGLAYVRAVARAHGGEATYESAPGRTRFAIELPHGHGGSAHE